MLLPRIPRIDTISPPATLINLLESSCHNSQSNSFPGFEVTCEFEVNSQRKREWWEWELIGRLWCYCWLQNVTVSSRKHLKHFEGLGKHEKMLSFWKIWRFAIFHTQLALVLLQRASWPGKGAFSGDEALPEPKLGTFAQNISVSWPVSIYQFVNTRRVDLGWNLVSGISCNLIFPATSICTGISALHVCETARLPCFRNKTRSFTLDHLSAWLEPSICMNSESCFLILWFSPDDLIHPSHPESLTALK